MWGSTSVLTLSYSVSESVLLIDASISPLFSKGIMILMHLLGRLQSHWCLYSLSRTLYRRWWRRGTFHVSAVFMEIHNGFFWRIITASRTSFPMPASEWGDCELSKAKILPVLAPLSTSAAGNKKKEPAAWNRTAVYKWNTDSQTLADGELAG